jgi:hypothetical protein
MDLLTAVMHELGHVLGYDHSEAGPMRESLVSGVRRLWGDGESSEYEVLLDPLADEPSDNSEVDTFFASVM